MRQITAIPLTTLVIVLFILTPVIKAQQSGNTNPSQKMEQQVGLSTRDELLEGARQRFVNHIDTVIAYLERINGVITESDYLPESDKSVAQTEIADLVVAFESISVDVADAETREGFKSVALDVRTLWGKAHDINAKYIGLHVTYRFQLYAQRMDTVAQRVQLYLNEQSARGIGVSEPQLLVNEYAMSIERANSVINEAKSLGSGIAIGSGNAKEKAELAQTRLRNAKQELHQAGQLLHNALLLMQQNYNVQQGQ